MSVPVPMPFAPVKAAAALWHTTPQAAMGYDPVSGCTKVAEFGPEFPTLAAKSGAEPGIAVLPLGALVPPPKAVDPCQLGVITLGGPLAPDEDANEVWFDPRKVKLAAPPFPEFPPVPKTQFAPNGPALMEALPIGFGATAAKPCVCRTVCPGFVPTSLAALLCTVRNGVRVQRALAAAGVIVVSPELAAATDATLPCFCAGLGRDADLTAAFANFAASFSDTAVITLQDPPQYVQYLNTVFVQQTLSAIQHQVITAAAINYARAEPNTAYLVARPSTEDVVFDREANYTETGARTQHRALSDPLSTPARRAELAAMTGLPIGGASCVARV